MSGDQIKDIKDAIDVLPKGKTLLQSVQKVRRYFSEFNLTDLVGKFLDIKKTKYEAGKLSKDEFIHIKGRVYDFKKRFLSFDDISPEALSTYLKSKGS